MTSGMTSGMGDDSYGVRYLPHYSLDAFLADEYLRHAALKVTTLIHSALVGASARTIPMAPQLKQAVSALAGDTVIIQPQVAG